MFFKPWSYRGVHISLCHFESFHPDFYLDLFKPGFVFDGETTGKLQHTHVMSLDGILETKEGDLYADYIDLSPADYTLDDVDVYNWEKIFDEEISIQYYEEE